MSSRLREGNKSCGNPIQVDLRQGSRRKLGRRFPFPISPCCHVNDSSSAVTVRLLLLPALAILSISDRITLIGRLRAP